MSLFRITKVDFLVFLPAAVAIVLGWYVWQDKAQRDAYFAAEQEKKAEQAAYEALPATDWFFVRELMVPDFVVGENPVINYDRTILKDFPGRFKIQITEAKEKGALICVNSKDVDYIAGRQPPAVVTFGWLFGDAEWPACSARLVPGSYQGRVTWEIHERHRPVKELVVRMNVFNVLEPGTQKYLEPEQLMKLEALP